MSQTFYRCGGGLKYHRQECSFAQQANSSVIPPKDLPKFKPCKICLPAAAQQQTTTRTEPKKTELKRTEPKQTELKKTVQQEKPKSGADDPVFIFLDTETTGIGQTAEILELSMVRVRASDLPCKDARVMHSLTLRFRPKGRIDPRAAEVHGITLDKVQHCATFAQCIPAISSFFSEARPATIIAVAHNTAFDRKFIAREFANAGQRLPPWLRWSCTLRMFQALRASGAVQLEGDNKLGSLHQKVVGRPLEGAHGALADTVGIVDLLSHLGDVHVAIDWLVENADPEGPATRATTADAALGASSKMSRTTSASKVSRTTSTTSLSRAGSTTSQRSSSGGTKTGRAPRPRVQQQRQLPVMMPSYQGVPTLWYGHGHSFVL